MFVKKIFVVVFSFVEKEAFPMFCVEGERKRQVVCQLDVESEDHSVNISRGKVQAVLTMTPYLDITVCLETLLP